MVLSLNPGRGDFWLGLDPGGDRSFGMACLGVDGKCRTAVVSCADDAVALIDRKPSGVGVDAPLWWSSGRSGDRHADQWIRRTYRIPSGTVQAANSLRGAALVQGAMVVHRLREKFPGLRVTEVHPKAVAKALGGWNEFTRCFPEIGSHPSEHERDAVVAAIAAREGFEGRWTRDLACHRLPAEQDPFAFWLAPVHYYWPVA